MDDDSRLASCGAAQAFRAPPAKRSLGADSRESCKGCAGHPAHGTRHRSGLAVRAGGGSRGCRCGSCLGLHVAPGVTVQYANMAPAFRRSDVAAPRGIWPGAPAACGGAALSLDRNTRTDARALRSVDVRRAVDHRRRVYESTGAPDGNPRGGELWWQTGLGDERVLRRLRRHRLRRSERAPTAAPRTVQDRTIRIRAGVLQGQRVRTAAGLASQSQDLPGIRGLARAQRQPADRFVVAVLDRYATVVAGRAA